MKEGRKLTQSECVCVQVCVCMYVRMCVYTCACLSLPMALEVTLFSIVQSPCFHPLKKKQDWKFPAQNLLTYDDNNLIVGKEKEKGKKVKREKKKK